MIIDRTYYKNRTTHLLDSIIVTECVFVHFNLFLSRNNVFSFHLYSFTCSVRFPTIHTHRTIVLFSMFPLQLFTGITNAAIVLHSQRQDEWYSGLFLWRRAGGKVSLDSRSERERRVLHSSGEFECRFESSACAATCRLTR